MTDYNWITGVLEDLETFAEKNAMSSLRLVLRTARATAENEIKTKIATTDRARNSFL